MFALVGRTFVVSIDHLGRQQVNLLTHSNGKTNENEFFNQLYLELRFGETKGCASFRGMKINYKKYHKKIFSEKTNYILDNDRLKFLMELIFNDLVKFERKIQKTMDTRKMEKK